MKKNRILILLMVILLITVCVYIPMEIPKTVERNENPNTSNPTETLIFGTDVGPSSLDPHYIWETASFNVIDQVVETLFAYDLSNPSLEIIPRLAADFGSWDATGLIYTVPIKTVGTDGNPIKFHDGTIFDANVVVSSFERLFYFLSLDPENPSTPDPPMFWELYHWPDGTPIINSVENVGGDIKFTLNRKFAPFEALLCFSGSGILSDDDLSTPPNDYIDLSGDLVGTGPFNYISYTPYHEVRFQKFGDYWAGPAHIDELIFSIIPDTTARMNALLAGSIDYINDPESIMLQTFRESSHITLLESGGDAIIRCLGMNNQLIPLEMRKAISYAIDYYRIIEEYMDGEAIRLRSPIPLGIRDANWGFNVPETDIIKARQTLIDSGLYGTLPSAGDDQGWENLVSTNPIAQYSLVYYWDTNNPRMVLVDIPKRNLKRIGVRVLEERISWEEFLRRGAEDRDMLELFWLGWGPDYNDPCDYINFLFADDGTSNFGQVNDEIVQGWIDQAISELDSGIRETHYDNIQKRLVEEIFPWCWGYVERNWDAFNNDFTGFQSNHMEKLWFHSVRRTITQVKSNWLINPVNVNGFVSGGEWDDADAYIVPLNLTWGWPNRQTIPSGEQLTVRFKNDAEWLYILYEIPYSELGATEPESAGIASWFYYGSQSDNGWVGLGGGKGDEYGWNGVVWNTDTNNDVEGIGLKDDVNNIYRFEFKKKLDTGDGQDWSLWPGEVVSSPIAPAELPHIIVYLYDDEFYPKTFEQYISLQLSRPQLISNWLVNEVNLDGIASTGEWADTNLYNLPLYNVMGWPSTVWLRSNKVLTTRFKNDGEWLYMLYEIPWIWSDDPPDSAGISLFSFFGNPRTNTDSGWLQIAGGVPVDYYGWNGYNWLFDTDVSGQNDVEGVGVIDGDIYRIEFRKRLNSKDGWDWSLTPGETVGSPFGPPSLAISLYDAYTNSVYEQYISLNLMRSNTIHITNDFTLTTDLYFEAGDGIIIDADDITIDGKGHKIIGSTSGAGIINGFGHDSLMIKNVTVQDFFAGIALFGVQNSDITGNYISENKMGIILSDPSTLNELTNNIITRNELWGIMANSTGNTIWRNLLINNVNQIVPGFNSWYDATEEVGNFWSDYFGLDNGNLGREIGDYIGDTEIPHLGVDFYPLLDPSIPEWYGPLPYADWWMWGRGGSDASLSIVAPNGDEISEFVNTIGKMAFWASNPDYDEEEGEARELVMVALDPFYPIDDWEGGWALEVRNNADVTDEIHVNKVISGGGTIESERSFTESLDPGAELIVIDDFQYADPGEPADVEPGEVIIQDISAPIVEIYQPDNSEHIYGSCVEVVGYATDDEGLASITVIGGTPVILPGPPDPTEFSFTSTVESLDWGENSILIIITDISGNSITVQRTVFREDPEITSFIGPLEPVAEGNIIDITSFFYDPDVGDSHIAEWDWGDGETTFGIVDFVEEELYQVTGTHEYEIPGVYTITLTVVDSFLKSHTVSWSHYMVVYDPSGSFVTGGGWIDSPVYAYPADPDLIGKANFGFVAKYKKGSNEPIGNTEFQFQIADLNFHSDNYEWLVIAGSMAMFKGTGTITGEGSYKFKLIGIDGEIAGDGIDKFRIKIWEEDDDTGEEFVIYDNKLETPVGGGSIMIHKKTK